MTILCPICKCAVLEPGWTPSILECPICNHQVYVGR